MKSKLLWFALAVTLGLPALAAESPELQALIDEALRNNREMMAAQKRLEASRQRPGRESSLPEPMLSLGYTSNGGPWPVAGIGAEPTANAGFMVTQEFPFPGKRKLRGEVAGKEAEAELQQLRTVELNVVSRAKQAYHRLHHGYAAVDIMARNRDLLGRFVPDRASLPPATQMSGRLLLPGASRTAGIRFCCPVRPEPRF